MSKSRRRDIPAEGSWRLVDGENDSFDTSILPAFEDDDNATPLSSGQPSSGYPTQLFSDHSQSHLSFNSQDSIRDFSRHQEDEQVILREPFRPSLPSASRSNSYASTATWRQSYYPTPEMQFRMPVIDIDSGRAGTGRASSRGWGWNQKREGLRAEDSHLTERKGGHQVRQNIRPNDLPNETWSKDSVSRPGTSELPFLSRMIWRTFGAFRFVMKLLFRLVGIFLGIYLLCGSTILLHGFVTKPLAISLSPVCRIPDLLHLNLPFCPVADNSISTTAIYSIDFDRLIEAQGKFEHVLEEIRTGSSIPLELEQSERAAHGLKRALKNTDVTSIQDIISDLNGFIEKIRRARLGVQAFNIHVGSAFDAVININRWTVRHIDSLYAEHGNPELPAYMAQVFVLFQPFMPTHQAVDDRVLIDKYVEHITLVRDRLEKLIDEGRTLSVLLRHGQGHLSVLYESTKRFTKTTFFKRDGFFSDLWAYLTGGGSSGATAKSPAPLKLDDEVARLREADSKTEQARLRLLLAVGELEDVQISLAGLLASASAPIQASSSSSSSSGDDTASPKSDRLRQQIEILRKGVDKLALARRRRDEAEETKNNSPRDAVNVEQARHEEDVVQKQEL